MNGSGPTHLVFVFTEDWFFHSHFLARAKAALKAGYRVSVVARDGEKAAAIRAAGLGFHAIGMQRSGTSPLAIRREAAALAAIFREIRPDIVHNVGLRPILVGSIAAKRTGVPGLVNAVVGMGYVFSTRSFFTWLIRPALSLALAWALHRPGSVTVLENPDDLGLLKRRRLAPPESLVLIPGAGADPDLFAFSVPLNRPPVVVLAARMLYEKGVGTFVAAARILKRRGIEAEFAVYGRPDSGNRGSIPKKQLEAWNEEGAVVWHGHADDMHEILGRADIACLPSSYGEGLPRFLLEAAAAGAAIVTTNIPGCRFLVKNGETGLLVRPQDPEGLAAALERLIADEALRQRLATNARAELEARFSDKAVIDATLGIYQALLPA